MIQTLHAFCAVAAGVSFCYMLHALWRDRDDPALRYLCACFGLSATSFTLLVPAVWVRVDGLFGVPNISALLAMSSVTCLVFGQQIALQYWTHPPAEARRRARRRMAVCGLVLTAMAVLFTCLDPSVQRPRDFSVYYGHSPYYFAYLVLYISVYTTGEVIIARTAWRHARATENVYLRRGLRFLAVGAWLTLGYSAIRIVNLFGPRLGFDFSHRDEISWVFGNTGSLLTMLGFTFPGWGPRLSLANRWRANLLRYHRLYRLWATMHRAVPEIALFPPRRRIHDVLQLGELEFRLYRRVIEIRDGQLALLPYADEAAVAAEAEAAGRTGLDAAGVRAIAAATAIRTAVDRRRAGLPPRQKPALPAPAGPPGADLDSEIAELLRVSRALSRPAPATHKPPTPTAPPSTCGARPVPRPDDEADAA
ncbi:MAB_1171c family putative transporter [Streptomyces sp. NPDC003090]|uniref:MAB_1171c family putative transporter n=1 Tax=Streptomyces sp. NPDC003090 TaxID=3154274 RepID=UPI00381ADBD5